MAESALMEVEVEVPRTAESVSVGMAEDTVSAEFVPVDEDAKTDDVMKTVTPRIETPDQDSVNGLEIHGNGNIDIAGVDIDDDLNNEELTPPPDTPVSVSPSTSPASVSAVDEPMSRTPSMTANALEDEKDEIVVGTNANKHLLHKASPTLALSETADIDMDDVEDESIASQKRKRVSTYADLAEEDISSPAPRQSLPDARPRVLGRPAKTHGVNGVKGTLLGYWRDSTPKDPKDKHGVIGFIDVRDRLRTRIQPTTRDGRNIVLQYPLPPGPGGSWVTFQQVAFDPHLVNLNQHQVKEYVKIRVESQSQGREETPEEREVNEKAAVQEALRRIRENPPPPGATEPLVAYGTDIPEHALPQNRPEAKKRKLNPAAQPSWAVPGVAPVVQLPHVDNLPGSRPTRILLGYWKMSDQAEERDRHAVYGILGSNDMFRIKLVRETRDGRPCSGNFPQGAGALWIHWEECVFEPHLRNLNRPEVKEYVRVRQAQLDRGEQPEERVDNETKAVYEAQQRVTASNLAAPGNKREEYGKREEYSNVPIAMKTIPAVNGNGNGYEDGHPDVNLPVHAAEYPPLEPRPRRADTGPRGRHSLPDVELRAANRPPPVQRTNDLARRQVDRLETVTMRQEQRAMDRQPYGNPVVAPPTQSNHNKMQFSDNVSRLNKVWETQEANRLRAGAEDAKIFMGIKYERKQNGPFEGKLVSQGTIISIDGEDYVEYRVLTKPSFF
ncbi:hypothetical protein B0T16DRAFT_386884 [Cercophora newfieldiana]|uniref:Uncharacterized protein n=1 Tax=Cercophora newfieldiana TaxID=92897 RepID=A0AA39YFK2_9PEZI|nr:hypothetical protein B0T16DRAFT_386884 [Cercophora newfieldiana]